jgi:hypothetical protein
MPAGLGVLRRRRSAQAFSARSSAAGCVMPRPLRDVGVPVAAMQATMAVNALSSMCVLKAVAVMAYGMVDTASCSAKRAVQSSPHAFFPEATATVRIAVASLAVTQSSWTDQSPSAVRWWPRYSKVSPPFVVGISAPIAVPPGVAGLHPVLRVTRVLLSGDGLATVCLSMSKERVLGGTVA